MSRRRALQAVISTALMAALVLGAAAPSSAATLPLQPFAMWPPNYCAASYGTASYLGSQRYGITAVTYSLKAAGADGVCNDASPAVAGIIAVQPRLQAYFAPAGGWVVCDVGDTHRVNATGQWYVYWSGTVFGCASSTTDHRLWVGARITYGGTANHSHRYSGAI